MRQAHTLLPHTLLQLSLLPSSLRALRLAHNSLAALAELRPMPRLQARAHSHRRAAAHHAPLTAGAHACSHSCSLLVCSQLLDAASNALASLHGLERCPALTSLDLRCNPLGEAADVFGALRPLAGQRLLSRLDLRDSGLTALPQYAPHARTHSTAAPPHRALRAAPSLAGRHADRPLPNMAGTGCTRCTRCWPTRRGPSRRSTSSA